VQASGARAAPCPLRTGGLAAATAKELERSRVPCDTPSPPPLSAAARYNAVVADLLSLSARILDSGHADEPVNRVTQELSVIGDDLAVVESFSHVVALRTAGGLVLFDTSGPASGAACLESLRKWSTAPLHALVYTHGHLDHVGGSGAFLAESRARGDESPRVIAHANVAARFARYRRTDGYNLAINARQFGGIRAPGLGIGGVRQFLPDDVGEPTESFTERTSLDVGGTAIELRHARGETDDHLYAWIPSHAALCAGDFFIWNFPNAGNPQKVQRYPLEWAAALREMAELGAELLLPAHGLPIGGAERIRTALCETARALETLVEQTLARMNAGMTLDSILHEVRVPDELLGRPYLRPLYDEPEFVVRNIWRLYGGWYDGNPARLKPPSDAAAAREIARLCGGSEILAEEACRLAAAGDLRLSCHLIELAVAADPHCEAVHGARAEIYELRRSSESSLMAKGIYAAASRDSLAAIAKRPAGD
jgi:alkyl sulfatase BDS1-like metallo-beta-lactamase superfamily hydrolase